MTSTLLSPSPFRVVCSTSLNLTSRLIFYGRDSLKYWSSLPAPEDPSLGVVRSVVAVCGIPLLSSPFPRLNTPKETCSNGQRNRCQSGNILLIGSESPSFEHHAISILSCSHWKTPINPDFLSGSNGAAGYLTKFSLDLPRRFPSPFHVDHWFGPSKLFARS